MVVVVYYINIFHLQKYIYNISNKTVGTHLEPTIIHL